MRALRPDIDIKIYEKNIHASISLTEAYKRISALQHNILERKEPLYKKGKKKTVHFACIEKKISR